MLKKLPQISLIVFGLLSIIASVLFFVGLGDETFISPNTFEEMTDSSFSDLFLGWAYVLFAIAFCLVIIFSVIGFVKNFKYAPKKAVRTLVVLVVLVAIFVISWSCGSAEELKIVGYDGTDNVGFWAQFSDMIIFTAYTLVAGTVLALIGSIIYSKVK